jgi:hypothetical protein
MHICAMIMFLLRHNFTDLEIGMFFAKYDINEDKEIEKEETMRILMDLEGRHVIGKAISFVVFLFLHSPSRVQLK